jgi:hypothetical protein
MTAALTVAISEMELENADTAPSRMPPRQNNSNEFFILNPPS